MKPIYKADDDSEHKTAALADKRNKLIVAQTNFEAAAEVLTKSLGESVLTADGEPFCMTKCRTYWRIARVYGAGFPRIAEVYVWPHNSHVDTDRKDEALCVRWWSHDGRESRYESYRINELYANKDAAKAANLEECRKYAQQVAEELATIEADGK